MSFGGKNSMSLIKCNKCGEVYSDSYKKCPFCVEDEEYYNGKVKKRGHRQMEKRKKAPSVVGPVLVLAVLVLVGILVWAFAGDTVRGWFGGDKQPEDVDPGTTQNQPVNTPVVNEPVVKALALDHMSLLMAPGESEKLTATGGAEESYQWITSDSGVAKVDTDGTVTAVAEGSAVITVTCGDENVACAVTVKEKADTNTTPNTNTNNNNTNNNNSNTNNNNTTNKPDTNTSSSLKNLKIKTEYGIDLAAREDGVYDITMQSSEKTCQLTLEGITGTPTWKSSNTNVVKVSSDGKLERVGKGEATVTITLGSATAEILVRVN
jgi:ribosomal protein L37E